MFKNISSRIILTFSSVVLAGLIIFAIITYGVFTKYSTNTDSAILSLSGKSVMAAVSGYEMLAEDSSGGHNCDPETIICDMYREQFEQNLEKYSDDNIGVHIYDAEGKLLIATKKCTDPSPLSETLKYETDKRIANGNASGFFTQFVFHSTDTEKSNLYMLPILDNEGFRHVGYIVVSSMSDGIYVARTQLIKALLSSCIMLIIGTAFSIIIIGKRIAKPINQICNDVKKYSGGRLDVRVNVAADGEIAELATSINEMMDTIERNDKNKDTFLASVAHDLRTPMTTISGFADGILDGTIPAASQERYLSIISEETKRLSRLISTLLTTTKMQNQTLHPKVFDITDKLISTLFTFEGKIEDKHLSVEILNNTPILVNADPDAIHQVLYNLIHNAVKFSPTGGSLVADITKDEENGKAFITIRNDGAGIPEEELPHVFDKFYKSDFSRGLDKSGMGLGLFIVKTVIDNHKEKITVDSGRNKGCAFTFSLSLATAKDMGK